MSSLQRLSFIEGDIANILIKLFTIFSKGPNKDTNEKGKKNDKG